MSSTDPQETPKPASAGIAYPDLIPSINPQFNQESFSHIQRQGRSHTFAHPESTVPGTGDLSFDTTAPDTIATEYRRLRSVLEQRLLDDKELKKLVEPQSQADYEKRLTDHVSAVLKATMFDAANYRQDQGGGVARSINAINTTSEYDCEHLAYIKGMLMHEGDAFAVSHHVRKEPTAFFLMSGSIHQDASESIMLNSHHFIASAATGNIIEATSSENSYHATNRSFEALIAGYPADAGDGIYATGMFVVDEQTVRARLAVIQHDRSDVASLAKLRGKEDNDIALRDPQMLRGIQIATDKAMPSLQKACGHAVADASAVNASSEASCLRVKAMVLASNFTATQLAIGLGSREIIEAMGGKRFPVEFASLSDISSPSLSKEASAQSTGRDSNEDFRSRH